MSNKDKEESLITHLEALRNTLIKCISSIALSLPISFYFAPKILNLLLDFLMGKNKVSFNYFSPVEVFILEIKISILFSFIIAFPYIAKKIWDFILPALYSNERKFIKTISFISVFLFVLGVGFCLFLILPLIVRFGLSFSSSNIQAMFNISNIVNLSLWLCTVFGLMFQIPLFVNMLIRWDIIKYNSVASKRPYVVVLLLFCCAFLTPPDVVSQLMLFIPTYLLFEIGLLFSKKRENNES